LPVGDIGRMLIAIVDIKLLGRFGICFPILVKNDLLVEIYLESDSPFL
jgi:hypothetical protein